MSFKHLHQLIETCYAKMLLLVNWMDSLYKQRRSWLCHLFQKSFLLFFLGGSFVMLRFSTGPNFITSILAGLTDRVHCLMPVPDLFSYSLFTPADIANFRKVQTFGIVMSVHFISARHIGDHTNHVILKILRDYYLRASDTSMGFEGVSGWQQKWQWIVPLNMYEQ